MADVIAAKAVTAVMAAVVAAIMQLPVSGVCLGPYRPLWEGSLLRGSAQLYHVRCLQALGCGIRAGEDWAQLNKCASVRTRAGRGCRCGSV